jgi:TPR repeat protein
MNFQPLPRGVLVRKILVCVLAAGALVAAVPASAQSVESLKTQAKEGNAEAQYELAKAYISGQGIAKDVKQGMEWLEKSAVLEHAGAQDALWVMYRKGFTPYLAKDPKRALEWLRKSADHNYATAEYELARLYLDGDAETGVSRNPKEAAKWFRKAARQPGSDKSRASLEDMLHKGWISKQEANWHVPEPVATVVSPVPAKEPAKNKAVPSSPFSLAEVETGLKGWITNNRMAILVQTYGVNFSLNGDTRNRLLADGADPNLLQVISNSKR